MDKKILPLMYDLKESFGTEGLIALMGQLDLEIDRQNALLSAFRW